MVAAGYRIRPARDGDMGGVVACLEAAFEPYRAQYTEGGFRDTVLTLETARQRLDHMTILVAVDASDRVVGTIACHVAGAGDGHVRGMAVFPELHGQGIADALLAEAESTLRAARCTRVTLDTTQPLERAVRFYTRHGYAPTGAITDFFGMALFEYAKSLSTA